MSGTPTSKDQYDPPLGSYKTNNQHNSLLEKNKASSSISLRPQTLSSRSNITLASLVKTPTPSSNISTRRYTPLQYTNILVALRDFIAKPSKLVSPPINT